MDRVGGVVALALAACFLFSLSAALQQRASFSGPESTGGVAGLRYLLAHLLKSPLWAIGFAVNLIGFVVQAFALEQGSVTIVQPLMPTQLLFAVGFAAWTARQWPVAIDWAASLCVCAGVAVIVTSASGRGINPEAALDRVPWVVVGAGVVVVALLVLAHGRSPRFAALATATAAGTVFATTAVFLKLSVDHIAKVGILHGFSYAVIGLVCTTTIATVLTQAAFAAGPLPWAVAAMTIVNPIASFIAGTLAFHAAPPSLGVSATAAALLVVGVVGLVRSRSAHGWSPA